MHSACIYALLPYFLAYGRVNYFKCFILSEIKVFSS